MLNKIARVFSSGSINNSSNARRSSLPESKRIDGRFSRSHSQEVGHSMPSPEENTPSSSRKRSSISYSPSNSTLNTPDISNDLKRHSAFNSARRGSFATDPRKLATISTIKNHPYQGELIAHLINAVQSNDFSLLKHFIAEDSTLSYEDLKYLITHRNPLISALTMGITSSLRKMITNFLQDSSQDYTTFIRIITPDAINLLKANKIDFSNFIDKLVVKADVKSSIDYINNNTPKIEAFLSQEQQKMLIPNIISKFAIADISHTPQQVISHLLEEYSSQLIRIMGEEGYINYVSNIFIGCEELLAKETFFNLYMSNTLYSMPILNKMIEKDPKYKKWATEIFTEALKEKYIPLVKENYCSVHQMEQVGKTLIEKGFNLLARLLNSDIPAINFIINILKQYNNGNLDSQFLNLFNYISPQLAQVIITQMIKDKILIQDTLFKFKVFIVKQCRKLFTETASSPESMEKVGKFLFKQYYPLLIAQGIAEEKILDEISSMLTNSTGNYYDEAFNKIFAFTSEEYKKIIIESLYIKKPSFFAMPESMAKKLDEDLCKLEEEMETLEVG